MSRALPPEIVVTETADGIRYRLPRPDLSGMRFVGCLLIAFGCLPAGMGAAFIAFAVTVMGGASGSVLLFAALLMLLPLAFVLVGLALMFLGGWMLAGRQEIELTARHVRGALCVGPLRWWRRRSRARLKQFTVVRGGQSDPGQAWDALQVECEGSKPLRLAQGYPEKWLRALARDLARRCRTLPAEEATAVVGVASESADPHDIRERTKQPVNSRVIVEEHADGLTLVMPPAGVWGGSHPLVVVWAFLAWGLITLVSVLLGWAALTGQLRGKHGEPASAVTLLALTPFWLIAAVALLVVLHRGRRRAALTAAGGRLRVVRSGLFGTRRWEWSFEEVADVCVACDRRARIGEGKKKAAYYPWQIDLRVVPRDGPALNVITYREGDPRKADLEWMATLLRRALAKGGRVGS